jgi:hypothetical protein
MPVIKTTPAWLRIQPGEIEVNEVEKLMGVLAGFDDRRGCKDNEKQTSIPFKPEVLEDTAAMKTLGRHRFGASCRWSWKVVKSDVLVEGGSSHPGHDGVVFVLDAFWSICLPGKKVQLCRLTNPRIERYT